MPLWRGVIEEYRERLPVTDATPVVTLREGGTPLVHAAAIIGGVLDGSSEEGQASAK